MAKKTKTVNNLPIDNKKQQDNTLTEETIQENESIQEEGNHIYSEEECETILNEKIETDIPLIDVVEFEKDINIEDIKLEQPQKKQNKSKISFEQMFGYFWNGQV